MSPSPVLVWMDTGAAPTPSSVMAGPSSLWRLTERRNRKAGSGNIFSNVNLLQLQTLFRAAGDQDAEQRAQLVWGHGDETELAQALISLRARSHRRGLRTRGRDALGSHWLRAFNHLRIGESSHSAQGNEPEDNTDSDSGLHTTPDACWETSPGATRRNPSTPGLLPDELPERPLRVSSGLKRGGDSDPNRYLHRILH